MAEDRGEILRALREKANQLPLSPGVYLMHDKGGRIIYVGKSKCLKNRVSQYFQEGTVHTVKTAAMVGQVRSFEYMLTDTEMEALTLENRLIKLHTPKYNIRLKDSKSYPYIKVTVQEEYPRVLVVRKRLSDGAAYFGPYSGITPAYTIVGTVRKAFGIPSCHKQFPKDIGKSRPCLNRQLGLCAGVCSGEISGEEYRARFREVVSFLRGNYRDVERQLREKMEYASEELQFEAAAGFRDQILALQRLWQKQKVVANPDVEHDVFALYTDEVCSCLTVFYVRAGAVVDSDSFLFPAEQIVTGETLVSFLCGLYTDREYVPHSLLLGFPLEEEEEAALTEFLSAQAGYRVYLHFPERGEKKQLCDMVLHNAEQQAKQYRFDHEHDNQTLVRLASLLGLEVVPERIESYDISNLGSEQITAGKVVLSGGKFDKSAYRVYKMRSVEGKPDDYASMREAVGRRLDHPEDPYPDLILLDGGKGHVSVIRALLREKGIDIPVFGMVKDEYHKTRALTGEDEEISVAHEQSVFQLLYRLQEEVHRFTVARMEGAKRKTLKTSSLEEIPGIGPAKAKALLAHFRTVGAIREAEEEALAEVKGISFSDAQRIREYFGRKES